MDEKAKRRIAARVSAVCKELDAICYEIPYGFQLDSNKILGWNNEHEREWQALSDARTSLMTVAVVFGGALDKDSDNG